MCSINVAEMRALVSSLESAETTVRSDVSMLQSTLSRLMLGAGEVGRATPVGSWIGDELVPTRRRLAMAEALQAATPNRSNYVNFDESAISTLTPAQAAAKAKQAVGYLRTGNTKALLALLSTEGYDPYFAKVFAQHASPRTLETYITTNFGSDGILHGGVDKTQYEAVLTGLGQTLSLATRGTGDLALGTQWTKNYVQWMTVPPFPQHDTADSERQHNLDWGARGVLMMIMARGQWSTPFLQHATQVISELDKPGFWYPPASVGTAVTPQGKTFTDPVVALMAALSHNPTAAKWAFTQGGTTSVPVSGRQVPVNSFLYKMLVTHEYSGSDRSVAMLALRAAAGGDKFSPVALDVQTLSTSLSQQQAAWNRKPWFEKFGHDILNFIGMIPVVGDLANIPNAAWYAAEGDWTDAGITAGSLIPVAGTAILASKVTKDLRDVSDVVRLMRGGALTIDDVTDADRSLALLRGGEQIEPGVITFTDEQAFREAANAPHPNTTYEFNGIRYTTDADRRTIRVSGTPLKTRGFANSAVRRAIGKSGVDGDVGMHLFAESFGGDTTPLNLVAGNGRVSPDLISRFKNLNTSAYAKMENDVRRAMKDPDVHDLNLTVEPIYIGKAARPEGFRVTITQDGVRRVIPLKNAPQPR